MWAFLQPSAAPRIVLTGGGRECGVQFENGLEISFKHCNIGGPGAGGLSDWLQAGATVFMRAERERAWKLNSVMQTLFPTPQTYTLCNTVCYTGLLV